MRTWLTRSSPVADMCPQIRSGWMEEQKGAHHFGNNHIWQKAHTAKVTGGD